MKIKKLFAALLALALVLSFSTATFAAEEDPLIAEYDFSDVSGLTVKDTSGNGNDAKLHVKTAQPEIVNGTLYLPNKTDDGTQNGTDAAGLSLPCSLFKNLDAWTITMDIKLTNDVDKMCLFGAASSESNRILVDNGQGNNSDGNPGGISWQTKPDSGDKAYIRLGAANQPTENGVAIPVEDQWHTLVFGQDGYNAVIYLDGVKIVEGTLTSTLKFVANLEDMGAKIIVGVSPGSSVPGAAGYFDNIQIFNKLMTPAEIEAYNNPTQSGGEGSGTGTGTGTGSGNPSTGSVALITAICAATLSAGGAAVCLTKKKEN